MAKFIIRSLAIQELRKQAFNGVTPEGDDFNEIDPKTYSALGNPVYSNLEFEPAVYSWKDNEFDFEGIVINTVLFTVNQTKNIVKTEIQGRRGTVKEYISDGDFQITVNGSIVSSEPKVYPREAVNRLKNLLEVPLPIQITSEFLNIFDISSVVVESYSFPQTRGVRNVQPFTIQLVSDEPLELQINAGL